MPEDLILETKLQPPQVKGKILRRQRLINLLNENLDKRLILVCADAGYGKTTLLAQFCSELDKPFIFYDLNASDNDLATFFNYLVMGIQRYYPDFGRRTRSVLPQTRNIEIIVGTFINEFVEHGTKVPTPEKQLREDFYIILDDYHHLQQNKEIGNALEYLLRHIPHNLHLIISSRSMPPLNLAYYFAKQELFEIKKEHLQFNIKEIQVLLKEIYNLKIPDAEIERIEKHSEGWITAIQLILQKVSVVGEEKAKETLNGYIASGEEIFDYFAREVFESQPKEVQEFLLKTSILEEITPEICKEVLEIGNAQEILEYLLEEHIFISTFEGYFKYHPLFRNFLFEYLRRWEDSQKIHRLIEKTAWYFHQKRDYIKAIELFLKMGNYKKVVPLIEQFGETSILSSRDYLLLSWIKQIPGEILKGSPKLIIFYAEAILWSGIQKEAINYFKKAVGIYRKRGDKIGLARAYIGEAQIKSNQGKIVSTIRLINKALKLLGNRVDRLKIRAFSLLGGQYFKLGQLAKTRECVTNALKLARHLSDRYELMILNNLGAVNHELGYIWEAEMNYKEVIKKSKSLSSPGNTITYCNLARISFLQNRLEDSFQYITTALDIARKINDKKGEIIALATMAEYYYEKKNYEEALKFLFEATEKNSSLGDEVLRQKILYDMAEVYLMKGNIYKSFSAIEQAIVGARRINNFFALPVFLLTKAKIKLEQEKYKEAEELLIECRTLCERQKRYFHLMEILFYSGKCSLLQEKFDKAKDDFLRMMDLIQEFEYDFYLKKIETTESRIIQFLIEEKIHIDYLQSVLGKITIQPKINVHLLGNLMVYIGNREVSDAAWKTEKIRSIFAYLIMNRKRGMSSEELMTTFYPDLDRNKASQNIRWAIYVIRQIFGKDFLNYQAKMYHVNPLVKVWVDIEEFDKKVKEAARSNKSSEKIQTILEILDLYRGDFLYNVYDSWTDEPRGYYSSKFMELLETTAEYYFIKEDFSLSLRYYNRIVQKDELNEKAYARLMEINYALGKKNEVVKIYKTMRKKFEEAGLPIGIEAQRVYQKLHILKP